MASSPKTPTPNDNLLNENLLSASRGVAGDGAVSEPPQNRDGSDDAAAAASTPKSPQQEISFNLKTRVLAALIYYILRLIFATCRVQNLGAQQLPSSPSVVLFWHSRLAFMGFLYGLQRRCGYVKTPYVLISSHKDGKLISCVMKHFGIRTIYGSSNRSPVSALLAIRRVLAAGDDVFITPDGPRGPAQSLSAGSIYIAEKFGANLAVVSNSSSRAWRFNSWDKMILPKPFSRLCFSILTDIKSEKSAILRAFAQIESLQKKAGFYV